MKFLFFNGVVGFVWIKFKFWIKVYSKQSGFSLFECSSLFLLVKYLDTLYRNCYSLVYLRFYYLVELKKKLLNVETHISRYLYKLMNIKWVLKQLYPCLGPMDAIWTVTTMISIRLDFNDNYYINLSTVKVCHKITSVT